MDSLSVVVYGFVAVLIFRLAWKALKNSSDPYRTTRKALLWILAIALWMAYSVGDPTCLEQADPLRGGCLAYSEGFEATMDQRVRAFLRLGGILGAPVMLAALLQLLGVGVATARSDQLEIEMDRGVVGRDRPDRWLGTVPGRESVEVPKEERPSEPTEQPPAELSDEEWQEMLDLY